MQSRIYECHGHIDKSGTTVFEALKALARSGVSYYRDGGDPYANNIKAKEAAALLGIDFVSPGFAIYKEGRYGKYLGRPYRSLSEYRELVLEAKALGADFIKLIISGIITFKKDGELSCPSLDAEEISALTGIAHDEGFAVMAHANGKDAVLAAVSAGVDSIEHGAFMDDECLEALSGSSTIWVPTIAAIAAFSGRAGRGSTARYSPRGGFDPGLTRMITENHMSAVLRAASLPSGSDPSKRVLIAAGSDSGAYGVPFGMGTLSEYGLLQECGVSAGSLIAANELLRGRFRR